MQGACLPAARAQLSPPALITCPARQPTLLQAALQGYLAAHAPGFGGGGGAQLEVFQFAHGQSNPTYLVKVLLPTGASVSRCAALNHSGIGKSNPTYLVQGTAASRGLGFGRLPPPTAMLGDWVVEGVFLAVMRCAQGFSVGAFPSLCWAQVVRNQLFAAHRLASTLRRVQ